MTVIYNHNLIDVVDIKDADYPGETLTLELIRAKPDEIKVPPYDMPFITRCTLRNFWLLLSMTELVWGPTDAFDGTAVVVAKCDVHAWCSDKQIEFVNQLRNEDVIAGKYPLNTWDKYDG